MMITSVFVRAFFMHSLCKTADSNMFPNVILPLSENKAAFLKKRSWALPWRQLPLQADACLNLIFVEPRLKPHELQQLWADKKKKKKKAETSSEGESKNSRRAP